jgi:hypothetical protein
VERKDESEYADSRFRGRVGIVEKHGEERGGAEEEESWVL